MFTGLVIKSKEHFWSHVAEYPTHHLRLPPNTEREFVESITNGEDFVSSLSSPFLRSPYVIPPLSTEFSPLPSSHSIKKAKEDIQRGMVFAFTEDQIDQIIARYQYLISVCFFLFLLPAFPPLFSLSLSLNYLL